MNPEIHSLRQTIPAAWRAMPGLRTILMPQIVTPQWKIVNLGYSAPKFRKLHLEIIESEELQVLHCVMYPRIDYDVPILGIDLVAYGGATAFAIADACPVTDALAPAYPVDDLLEKHGLCPVAREDMPPWGQEIFSDRCVLARRPVPPGFPAYALDVMARHLDFARAAPVVEDPVRVHGNHVRFCDCQLRNVRTRAALAKQLGFQRAEQYMQAVMFDAPQLPKS